MASNEPLPHVNPYIMELENKPKAILAHEQGAGSQCLICKEGCPGLDLHFWRKICKICKCRAGDHDVIIEGVDPGRIRIGKLFDRPIRTFQDELEHTISNYSTTSDTLKKSHPLPLDADKAEQIKQQKQSEELKQYTWVPPGTASVDLIQKYMLRLDEKDRPIMGSEGAQKRRQALDFQIPIHDYDPDKCQSLEKEEHKEAMEKFVNMVKEDVVGLAVVVDMDPNTEDANTQIKMRAVSHDFATRKKQCESCHAPMTHNDVGLMTERGPPQEVFHPNCFKCATCDQALVDMLYFYKDGKYYCGRHFADRCYPRCAACDELIFAKEYTRAEDRNWHLNHFCCFGCDLELGGHKYLLKEENPYCFNCYLQKFARVCQKCGNKIGPDVARIGHKDLHWHATPDCFQCLQCSKPLINQRFVIKNTHVFCTVDCKRNFYGQ